MSREISEENAGIYFIAQSNNENPNIEELAMSNPTLRPIGNSREDMETDNTHGEDSSEVNDHLMARVRSINLSNDQPSASQVNFNLPHRLNLMDKFSAASDSSESEDDGEDLFKGLQLTNLRNNDEFEDSETESNTDEFESEDEAVTTELEHIKLKKMMNDRGPSYMDELNLLRAASEAIPIDSIQLNNKEEFTHMGNLECIIDKIVTIGGLPQMPTYDIDTVLFINEGQTVLGRVLDVMGPVSSPVYIIPMISREAIENLQLQKGIKVYCAPKTNYTKYVILQELMKIRKPASSRGKERMLPMNNSDPSTLRYFHYEAPRSSSAERHRRFEEEMNERNINNTRTYILIDRYRVGYAQQDAYDFKTPNSSPLAEGRRSRPLYRNYFEQTFDVYNHTQPETVAIAIQPLCNTYRSGNTSESQNPPVYAAATGMSTFRTPSVQMRSFTEFPSVPSGAGRSSPPVFRNHYRGTAAMVEEDGFTIVPPVSHNSPPSSPTIPILYNFSSSGLNSSTSTGQQRDTNWHNSNRPGPSFEYYN